MEDVEKPARNLDRLLGISERKMPTPSFLLFPGGQMLRLGVLASEGELVALQGCALLRKADSGFLVLSMDSNIRMKSTNEGNALRTSAF
jgi:hypothetical protein